MVFMGFSLFEVELRDDWLPGREAYGTAEIHSVTKPGDVFVSGLEGNSEYGGGGFGRMVQLFHDGMLHCYRRATGILLRRPVEGRSFCVAIGITSVA